MTFDAAPSNSSSPPLALAACDDISVCDLNGVERFLVWSVRWSAALHDDAGFAEMCLQDSFDRAGLGAVLPVFRRYVATVHGAPTPCPPSARLGCWRINRVEAYTLHALASLQADRFGEAWHALAAVCPRFEAARAMLALGEIADALSSMGVRVRPWR